MLSRVRLPPGWQISCKPPHPAYDGRAFTDRTIEIYVDSDDRQRRVEMVVAHEIGHAWQEASGLPWGPAGYEEWAALRGLPPHVAANEDWADVFACYVGWCDGYQMARPATDAHLAALSASLRHAEDVWTPGSHR